MVEATSARGERTLQRQNVTILKERVISTKPSSNGISVMLQDGETIETDIYIDATTATPNTGFVPSHWLDDNKRVKTTNDTLKVVGDDAANVYAIGDVASYSNRTFMDVSLSMAPISSSIVVDKYTLHTGKPTETSNPSWIASFWKLFQNDTVPRQVPFKPLPHTQVVPIGRLGGVGEGRGVWLPSYFVYLAKSKTFFMEKTDKQHITHVRKHENCQRAIDT